MYYPLEELLLYPPLYAIFFMEDNQALLESQSESKEGNFPKSIIRVNGENDIYAYSLGKEAGLRMFYALQDAKKSIKIISPYFSQSQLIELLYKKSQCEVKLITTVPKIIGKYSINTIKSLQTIIYHYKDIDYRQRIDTVFYKNNFIHQKVFIIDDEIVFLGSFNFTFSGIYQNYETCITLKDIEEVKKINVYFDQLFTTDSIEKWDINELGKIIYNDKIIINSQTNKPNNMYNNISFEDQYEGYIMSDEELQELFAKYPYLLEELIEEEKEYEDYLKKRNLENNSIEYTYKILYYALLKKYNLERTDENYIKFTSIISNELKKEFPEFINSVKELKNDQSFPFPTKISKEMFDFGINNIILN